MSQVVRKCGKYLFFFVLLVLINASCDEIDSQIPDVPVRLTINLNIYNELTIPGNSILFEQAGFGGVIVSCEQPGVYFAYDAACTNEISNTCTIQNDGFLGTCSCCESKFILSGSAYPSEGPAAAPLKQYNISVLGGTTIRVYN